MKLLPAVVSSILLTALAQEQEGVQRNQGDFSVHFKFKDFIGFLDCVRQNIPDVLTVSSDLGPAGKEQWKRMGVFRKTGEEHNGRSVWANSDGGQSLFYNSG